MVVVIFFSFFLPFEYFARMSYPNPLGSKVDSIRRVSSEFRHTNVADIKAEVRNDFASHVDQFTSVAEHETRRLSEENARLKEESAFLNQVRGDVQAAQPQQPPPQVAQPPQPPPQVAQPQLPTTLAEWFASLTLDKQVDVFISSTRPQQPHLQQPPPHQPPPQQPQQHQAFAQKQ